MSKTLVSCSDFKIKICFVWLRIDASPPRRANTVGIVTQTDGA
jgi:hypothetical protein